MHHYRPNVQSRGTQVASDPLEITKFDFSVNTSNVLSRGTQVTRQKPPLQITKFDFSVDTLYAALMFSIARNPLKSQNAIFQLIP